MSEEAQLVAEEAQLVVEGKLVKYGPSRPAESREQAILVPRFKSTLIPSGEQSENSTKIIDLMNRHILTELSFEEAIQKQVNAYFTEKFLDPKFKIKDPEFKKNFDNFLTTSTKSTCIGQLGKNSVMIKNLMVSKSSEQISISSEEAEEDVVSTKKSLADKVHEIYPNDVKLYTQKEDTTEIGADALTRKKPNIDLDFDDKDLREMFAQWLSENGINPEDIKKRAAAKQTLICDIDRDMDVIKVEGIPTMNGIKNLELLVPREEKIKLGNIPTNDPASNDPASNEIFAENYIKMLGLKAEIEQTEQGIKMHNRLSSILFRCLLSLVLGYLYNNGLDMLNNAIFLGSVEPELAKDMAFQFVQGEVNEGILPDGNYTEIGYRYDTILSLLMKENVVNPDFKNVFLPDDRDAPLEQGFETLLEMIVRLANMEPGTEETPYLKILQGVCFNITLILNKYELITTAAGELVGPYWGAVVHLAANNSTIMQRLQSIVILAVAYNSYGWLFTVMAPLAIPSVVSVGSWALCSLARLPFGIIKFTGKGLLSVGKFFVGYQEDPNIMPIDPNTENTLIQVGWIKKQIGDNIKLIPHMVSKGDVQRLSHYIANHEIQKPSLLSSIFDAHGVADHNMQEPHHPDGWVWYLRDTNPVGRLIGCITEEFAELTVDDTDEVGYVKTLEERLFTLVCRTLRNESGDNGFTLQPLVEMWTETLFTKFYSAKQATYETFADSSFKDTLLESIVMMLNRDYKNYKNAQELSQPLSRTPSAQSNESLSTTLSDYSYKTPNGDDVVILANSSEDIDIINLNLDIAVPSRKGVLGPSLSRNSSTGSTMSDISDDSIASSSSVGSLSTFLGNTSGLTIRISKKMSDKRSEPHPILNPHVDPSVLFQSSTTIFQDLKAKATQMRLKAKATQMKALTEETQKEIPDNITILESLGNLSSEGQRNSNLSGYLVPDAVGSIMNGLYKFSLWISPLENQAGGYRRRNGPILATIGRKIVNNGIYRTIKPKLIASVYGKSKGRQRKRYTKKHGLKKARKQTTKKIRRKRRSTHKKYKRR